MMKREDLHLLIHEEIYLLEVENSDAVEAHLEAPELEASEAATASTIIEEIKEESKSKPSTAGESIQETSSVSCTVAIFHESTTASELELLGKIIDACQLTEGSFEVFANGFNKEVKFEKAIVFVASAKRFYEPVPFETSQILCSKPLAQIANDQQEKVKLWGALKQFL